MVDALLQLWTFQRERTLALLDNIAGLENSVQVLSWQPNTGRAHLGWQFTHIAITEELFATERFCGTTAPWPELAEQFKGGSTPSEFVPDVEEIRHLLSESRTHLVEVVKHFTPAQLEEIPPHFAERGHTFGTWLKILSWHEAHHQGQAHLTFNLWKQHAGV